MCFKEKQKGREPNPLNSKEKRYIKEVHENTTVPTMAKFLKRSVTTLNKYMDEQGMKVYNPYSYGRKRVHVKVQGFFYEHQHENWLV